MRTGQYRCALPVGLALLALTTGCGDPRVSIRGDADGVPVTVIVAYRHDGMSALAKKGGFIQRIVVERDYWNNDPFYHPHRYHRHHHHHWGPGPWYGPSSFSEYEPPTRLSLLAGWGPAEAQALRMELREGSQQAVIPIRLGRSVTLSIQSTGGLEGWTAIGTFTVIASGQTERVVFDQDGAHIQAPAEVNDVNENEPRPALAPIE